MFIMSVHQSFCAENKDHRSLPVSMAAKGLTHTHLGRAISETAEVSGASFPKFHSGYCESLKMAFENTHACCLVQDSEM